MITSYVVVRPLADGKKLSLGNVEHASDGWRFKADYNNRRSSRKPHPTLESALRTVGGLDRTETMTPEAWAAYKAGR